MEARGLAYQPPESHMGFCGGAATCWPDEQPLSKPGHSLHRRYRLGRPSANAGDKDAVEHLESYMHERLRNRGVSGSRVVRLAATGACGSVRASPR